MPVSKVRKSKSIKSPYLNKNKMNLKLLELINSVESLNKLSETKLPAGVAFGLGKFLKEVTGDIETYNKTRSAKVQEYGTVTLDEKGLPKTDDKGNELFTFTKENREKFVTEMKGVEEQEIEVKIPEIKISDLGTATIEPKFLTALTWLIKD